MREKGIQFRTEADDDEETEGDNLGAGLLAGLLAAVPAVTWRLAAPGGAEAAVAAGESAVTSTQGEPFVTSTQGEQVDVAVTVYNSNLALVRDVRELALPGGAFDLRFMDIAASVNPATVHLRTLTEGARLRVVEQNYEYDLLEPQRLLQKYIGREVILARWRQENSTSRLEEVRARLLALNNGPVWQIGNEIVTGLTPDHYRFPELPANLYSRPTLVWKLESDAARRQRIETSYLAGNMSWSADYVLTVARDDTSAGLDGWVTLVNNSGAAYRNARLQLVAGDLNRVRQQFIREAALGRAAVPAAEAPQFEREAFSDYHLYSLSRRTTLGERETKQISLLSAGGVGVEKIYVVDGQRHYYVNRHHPGTPLRDPVRVHYKFRNDEKSGLGMPLPAGVVRVYQADSRGGLQFAGEDQIQHTPRNEWITIHIGNAFDVVAERKQTDFRRISDRVLEAEFEITLRNQKDSAITVEVNEPVGGDWELLSSSHPARKTSAWSLEFQVPVEKEGKSVVRYRVRVRY